MDSKISLISAISGLVGTLGGVMISYLTLRFSYLKDRHRIKVDFGKNLLIGVPGVDKKKEQFTVMAANTGSVPYKVTMVTIALGRHSGGLALPDPKGTHKIPVTLEADETCNFWTDAQDSISNMKTLTRRKSIRVRVIVSDYTGRSFYSKWLRVQLIETRYSKFRALILKNLRIARRFFIA